MFLEESWISRTCYLTITSGLIIQTSQVGGDSFPGGSGAGLGCFLTRDVKAGDKITVYDGDLVHKTHHAIPRFNASAVSGIFV